MKISIHPTPTQMAAAAAAKAIQILQRTIARQDSANLILATGASQFAMLADLVRAESLDWSKVAMFHLDEYIGLDAKHPASFRRYLREQFVEKVAPLRAVHFVNADAPDPYAECRRLNVVLADHAIDLALVGIGENGHLAFNDPPADFETEDAYLVVDLDEACRRQQLGEGWFGSLEEVPTQAISMGIRQILKSRHIIVTVPDERKAQAVKDALEGPVTNACPASILQTHPDAAIFLDTFAASLLTG
ncbi:MAG: glucosamine-6-phosphate deaminase [Sedimentisphaerales bacterium]|nr:glucosamine-6-phosphate deaminase [Sedimentisphaerales bacterium]